MTALPILASILTIGLALALARKFSARHRQPALLRRHPHPSTRAKR